MKGFIASLICLIINMLQPKPVNAQKDSLCGLRISVLTCAPGDDLYSLFGHNALRIIDSTKRLDVIYNWGTFDFYDPDFYPKFVKGSLLYFLEPQTLQDFLIEYREEGRSVTEQILHLSCEQKMEILKAVQTNMIGDNKYYKYDFLFDNCTTRIRDILNKNMDSLKVQGSLVPAGTTFRNMIHAYLDKGSQPWSKLGIDILLGAKIDRPVTNYEAMFLPDYLLKGIDSSKLDTEAIVSNKQQILFAEPREEMKGIYEPLITIGVISVLLFLISLMNAPAAKMFTRISDNLLVLITGLIGLLLLYMWFFTDHWQCDNNYNLGWALPINFFVVFTLWKKSSWVKTYFKIAAVLHLLLVISWFWLPQEMNIALLPFCIYMLYRYIKLSKA